MIKNLLSDSYFMDSKEVSGTVELASLELQPSSVLNMYEHKRVALKDVKTFNHDKAKSINYKSNSYGHRSEEFNILPDKTNILFVGCSLTFGEGLPDNQYWPFYVQKQLLDRGIDLAPMQIMSFLGGSVEKIVYNTIKYVAEFGKPDAIMFLMPDPFRYFIYEPSIYNYRVVLKDPELETDSSIENKNRILYQVFYNYQAWYRTLDNFCKLNGITLISTSWSQDASEFMYKLGFESFVNINEDDENDFIMKHIDQDFIDKCDKSFLFESADGLHPGIYHNIFFGHVMLKRLLDLKVL